MATGAAPITPPGRPDDLTPELQDRIVGYIRGGQYPSRAALACGISTTTFQRWLQRGGEDAPCRKDGSTGDVLWSSHPGVTENVHENGKCPEQERFRAFRLAIERAEAEGEGLLVDVLAKHALDKRQPDSAKWLLERRHGWKERKVIEGASDGAPFTIKITPIERKDAPAA